MPRKHLTEYKEVAQQVAQIWKEHGALAYMEYVDADQKMQGITSFDQVITYKEDETLVFGWIVFSSQESRDLAHQRVAADLRMASLVEPLINPSNIIFDAKRMVFGGFKSLIRIE